MDAVEAAGDEVALVVELEAEDRGLLADMVELNHRLQRFFTIPSALRTCTLAVTGTGKCPSLER